ncbi:class I SAM-dependent methyltransferase [Candidatus Roseilinea sp. NK_OTU-006]|jgi:SAM-dependent methyltransferase|uniref:class I SAM-dependent methyltransferase n=1 Tax=Candidatus Roseilinea sp. NK_OTU-006 TaxID=2704250 RepID=UPI00145EA0A1|nr:class I SAM-dependent methyltransferase [Candidatus Roseilinea sp. NK_OTU-006]
MTKHTYCQAYHAAHLTAHPARAGVWKVISAFVSPYIPADGHVLELGAGYCYWINYTRAARKVAIDLWERTPEFAAPDVEVLLHDLSTGLACLGDQRFDAILASNVLEHLEPKDVMPLVAEIHRHLRPRGRLIVIQPNFYHAYRHYFDDYTHRSIFSHVSLANLLRAQGFHIEKVMPRFLPYSMRGLSVAVPAWLIRLYLASPFKPFAGQMLIVAQKPDSSPREHHV